MYSVRWSSLQSLLMWIRFSVTEKFSWNKDGCLPSISSSSPKRYSPDGTIYSGKQESEDYNRTRRLTVNESFITLQFKEGALHLIDQRVLPTAYTEFVCRDYRDVEFAIRDMVVRGAPAIGATAAYGVLLAAMEFKSIFTTEGPTQFRVALGEACDFLDASRPTAVNLHWALQRMLHLYDRSKWQTWTAVDNGLLHEADVIREEDI